MSAETYTFELLVGNIDAEMEWRKRHDLPELSRAEERNLWRSAMTAGNKTESGMRAYFEHRHKKTVITKG